MKKPLLCALACLMGCFFFTACNPGTIPEPRGIMQPTTALYEGLDQLKPQIVQPETETGGAQKYCIVLDDGFGMKGFIAAQCMSYRAALAAITDISMNHERVCFRASDLVANQESAVDASDTFFENAIQDWFFRDKSNEAASIIEQMARQYRQQPDQTIILLSDLMLPTEDDYLKAVSALADSVITAKDATMGIIAIVGEFRGTIDNLPISPKSGQRRNVRDYMVLERDANGNFRHPLYLLFMGNDQAVLAAMQKALSSLDACTWLDDTTPYYATYFSEYGATRFVKDDMLCEFNLGCEQYNFADYPVENLVRGVQNKDGKIRYPAQSELTDEYQKLLGEIRVAKIYQSEYGTTEQNVTIQCSVPFLMTDSSQGGGTISVQQKLLASAQDLTFGKDDYEIYVDLETLEYSEASGMPDARWVVPDAAVVHCDSKKISADRESVELVLSVNTELLEQDVPLLCKVSVRVGIAPEWDEVEALFQNNWVNKLTLNLREFDSESMGLNAGESSARFTAATTARTPFLENLICGGIAQAHIQSIIREIEAQSSACVETTMFGLVVRNVANRYTNGATWEDAESFNGWAFSVEEATKIKAAFDGMETSK